jgi:hypothetical protein
MRRTLFRLICFLCFSPALQAQWPTDKNACYYERKENAPFKKNLWDGYEVSLGTVPNPEEVEYRCTAAIYNGAGRVVFRTSGFNVVFDEEQTGKDFDGDGKPDVVLRTDTGGGNHCCWGYTIFSLSPRPHKLFEIAMEGRVDFEKDKEGKMVIWQRTSVPGGHSTSMAGRPFAEKVSRVRDGKLVDATPEFCRTVDERFERSALTPEELKSLERAGKSSFDDLEDVISRLEARTAQHVFCREFGEALKDLNLWPADQREIERKALVEAFGQEYPEFAEILRASAQKK